MEAGQRQEPLWREEPPSAPRPSDVELADAYELIRDAERHWREESRIPALETLLRQTKGLKLTRSLFLLLLEELAISDDFDEIVGNPDDLPASRFPQALAMAIALRRSCWRDDLESLAEALTESNMPVPPASRAHQQDRCATGHARKP
ncbi:MAG: hypothetical protein ACM3NQ_17370 [Bacteroidales bacterium]